MSNSEMWAYASELSSTRGAGAKRYAMRQAIRAKWNDQDYLFQDWVIIASRISAVATLS
jgi:hypothetical protein